MSENGEIYTAGKNFTLPPAVTGGTNLKSGVHQLVSQLDYHLYFNVPRMEKYSNRNIKII